MHSPPVAAKTSPTNAAAAALNAQQHSHEAHSVTQSRRAIRWSVRSHHPTISTTASGSTNIFPRPPRRQPRFLRFARRAPMGWRQRAKPQGERRRLSANPSLRPCRARSLLGRLPSEAALAATTAQAGMPTRPARTPPGGVLRSLLRITPRLTGQRALRSSAQRYPNIDSHACRRVSKQWRTSTSATS
jgi:hypothetical protein